VICKNITLRHDQLISEYKLHVVKNYDARMVSIRPVGKNPMDSQISVYIRNFMEWVALG
jgi:hypothetical protein